MRGKHTLLIVGGGIAAYNACELVRLIRRAGGEVTCGLPEGGQQFVTAMSLATESASKVTTSLVALHVQLEMGHHKTYRHADHGCVGAPNAHLMVYITAQSP